MTSEKLRFKPIAAGLCAMVAFLLIACEGKREQNDAPSQSMGQTGKQETENKGEDQLPEPVEETSTPTPSTQAIDDEQSSNELEIKQEDARLRLAAILIEAGIWDAVPSLTWNIMFDYFGGPNQPEEKLDIMWDKHYKITRNVKLKEVGDTIIKGLGERVLNDGQNAVYRKFHDQIRSILKDSLSTTRIETTDLWEAHRNDQLYDILNPALRAAIADFQLKIDLIRSSPRMLDSFAKIRRTVDEIDPQVVIDFLEGLSIPASSDLLIERQLELFRYNEYLLARYASFHPSLVSPKLKEQSKEKNGKAPT